MIKVVVIGPTPPPYHGQAIMIQNLVDAKLDGIKLFLVRASFSKDMNEIGKFNIAKIFALLSIIVQVFYVRIRYNAKFLYFGPGGPNLVPMFRDVILLCSTRWLFQKVILHFHAGSTYSLYHKIPGWLKYFFRKAYFNADIGIRITKFNPEDPKYLCAKKELIIPNGVYDYYSQLNITKPTKDFVTILFVGNIFKEKGIVELVEAINILAKRNFKFKVDVVGRFQSPSFERLIIEKLEHYSIREFFNFPGVIVGSEKLKYYYEADIFCLPTYFETFGLVIAEAMQFALPIVSTNVGGVPFLVNQNVNGFLVEKEEIEDLADKLETLISNKELRKNMGRNSRKLYLKNFSIEKFHKKMEDAFKMLEQVNR